MLLGLGRLYLLLISYPAIMGETDSGLCPSMDIRNSITELKKLSRCKIIEGFLHVVLMDKTLESDFHNISFPQLHEVTGYVMFFRVNGLKSIGNLFPNLSVIRGEILVQDYALIVNTMPHLIEIALTSLIILRGSVTILKNPNFCYADTIDWELVASGGTPLISGNAGPNDSKCPGCSCPSKRCWARNKCQVSNKLSTDANGDLCDKECVQYCTGPGPTNCLSCRHYVHKGTCVGTCPSGTYCINEIECRNKTLVREVIREEEGYDEEETPVWFVWNKTCISKCPAGYEKHPTLLTCRRCTKGRCKKVCYGANVDSLQMAQNLRDCTYINGSLEIHIRSGKQAVVAKELEENLGKIEEIKGYLKVVRSFPIISLDFFQNLRIIHGISDPNERNTWVQRNVSLVIFDNQNLKEIWNWNKRPAGRNFTIARGRPFFHYNPNLCLKHIEELMHVAGIKSWNSLEIAKNSNGGRFACHVISFNVSVHLRYKNSIVLLINRTADAESVNPKHNFMRYVVYYVEASSSNVSLDTDSCAENGWRVNDVSNFLGPYDEGNMNGSVYHTITWLNPYTMYAFYVKTYTVDSTGGQSSTQYVRTLPSTPTMPLDYQVHSNSSSEIVLSWNSPESANGRLVEYIVTGFIQEDNSDFLLTRDFCKVPITKTIIPTLPPKFITRVKSSNNSCCKEELPKEKIMCNAKDNSLPRVPIFDEYSCEKYMYDRIETAVESFDHHDLIGIPRSKRQSQFEETGNNGEILTFHRSYNAETKLVTISGLKHYSSYTIKVVACRERDPDESNLVERCSRPAFETIRTKPMAKADDIKGLKVRVVNQTVTISWKPPVANGIIVSYHLELLRMDRDETLPIIDCIPAQSVEETYVLKHLGFGSYRIRMRSISLAGPGVFTPAQFFKIEEDSFFSIILTFIFVGLSLIVIAATIYGWYYYEKRKNTPPILIASVNPEYTSITAFDPEWELPRERIRLGKEMKRGNFGMVCEGILTPEGIVVAVKKSLDASNPRDVSEFLNEAMIMRQFVNGPHIVKLIGVVSKSSPQLVVMEMMANGDLKTFLRESRNKIPPSMQRMIIMAAEISDGMAFLENSKFVHRDLAARNCMVSGDGIVKIGDFGMTRDVYETDYYRKDDKGLLPIRWMAPESLNDGIFTCKSDSWSYGIVLWEMATLACQPYQGMSNEQVLDYVVTGNKLELPPAYPKPFKSICNWCWKWKPKLRPNFIQILAELEDHLTVSFRQSSFYNSEAGLLAREAVMNEPYIDISDQSVSFTRQRYHISE